MTTLHNVLQKADEFQESFYRICIDYKKALFDSIGNVPKGVLEKINASLKLRARRPEIQSHPNRSKGILSPQLAR